MERKNKFVNQLALSQLVEKGKLVDTNSFEDLLTNQDKFVAANESIAERLDNLGISHGSGPLYLENAQAISDAYRSLIEQTQDGTDMTLALVSSINSFTESNNHWNNRSGTATENRIRAIGNFSKHIVDLRSGKRPLLHNKQQQLWHVTQTGIFDPFMDLFQLTADSAETAVKSLRKLNLETDKLERNIGSRPDKISKLSGELKSAGLVYDSKKVQLTDFDKTREELTQYQQQVWSASTNPDENISPGINKITASAAKAGNMAKDALDAQKALGNCLTLNNQVASLVQETHTAVSAHRTSVVSRGATEFMHLVLPLTAADLLARQIASLQATNAYLTLKVIEATYGTHITQGGIEGQIALLQRKFGTPEKVVNRIAESWTGDSQKIIEGHSR